jgi:ribose 1,5-bisphosphokinase
LREPAAASIGPGVFVPVVGPSGAGKDSLMTHAARRLAGDTAVHFARRVITRPADPGAEAHDTLDEASFLLYEAAGAFALSWRSHGLCYGIPESVDETIRAGGVVVANLSRASVPDAVVRYRRVMPVLVTVSPDILAARLAARGRESAGEIAARIARNAAYADFGARCHVIDNSGALDEAGERLVRLLRAAAQHSPAAVA